MRVLVATDAWHPQVNGVVRTYERLASEAPSLGFELSFLAPPHFRTLPCPTYPEIRLALAGPRAIARHIEAARARFYPHRHGGTDRLHDQALLPEDGDGRSPRAITRAFPEYVSARLPVPEDWCYALQRRFHNGAAGTFVATPSLAAELEARGFARLMPWSRGVDTDLFKPRNVRLFGPPPVFLYVGRIAVEKNVTAFLDLELPGRKVVVGSGPQTEELKRRYPDVLFTGSREGKSLAEAYASADVFVFPSMTDTFGLVLLEALAAGLPVAAFPTTGPLDVITDSRAGVLDADLRAAALRALTLDGAAARAHALRFSWENSARQFFENVLAAHHLGLPAQRMRRRRAGDKRKRPGGGNQAVFTLMRQFGGRFGGTRVFLEMVGSFIAFKGRSRIFP